MPHWFDPKLNLAEDYDFLCGLLSICRVVYLHDILAIYRHHEQNHTVLYSLDFPEEMIYSLEKLRRISNDSQYSAIINNRKNGKKLITLRDIFI